MHLPDWLVPPYWVFQLWDKVRTPQSWTHNGRWFVGIIAFLVLAGTGFGWTQVREVRGLTEVRQVDALTALPTAGPKPVLTIGTDIGSSGASGADMGSSAAEPVLGVTYLVAGVDSRAGSDGQVGAGTGADVAGARSDTIALIHVTDNGVPKVVSIPRDSAVYRPACHRWHNDSSSYSSDVVPVADEVKINSTYADGGPRCLVSTVQQLTGIKVDKFIGVDFAGMIRMVDAVGGVDIDTPYPLVDDELGVIVGSAGRHHLNGSQALAYSRARKIAQEGKSDYGRIKRQQKLVEALTARIKQQTLSDPTRLNELANTFTHNVFGDNVSVEDLLNQLRNLTGAQFQTLPTVGTDEAGNETVDRNALGAMLQSIWGGTTNATDREASTTPSAASSSTSAGPTAIPFG